MDRTGEDRNPYKSDYPDLTPPLASEKREDPLIESDNGILPSQLFWIASCGWGVLMSMNGLVFEPWA